MRMTLEIPIAVEKWPDYIVRGEMNDFSPCPYCEIHRPTEQFQAGRSKCVVCRREYDRARRAKDPEKHREQCRQYRLSRTPEKIRRQRLLAKEYKKKTYRERGLLSGAKKRAREKNVEFDLEVEDIFIPEFCPLLGIKIESKGFLENRDSSPSLDRINPSMGYVRGNVAVISYRANRIKNDASPEELKLIAARIDQYIVLAREGAS